MEDTLQRVFSIIISVIIFFLLPLYMAFEKKDDISYSLALKITSNFTDEVCNKGYMTIDMYNDFVSQLAITGNSYDIKLEHIANVYNPVIYAYSGNKQYSFDYNLYKNNYNPNSNEIEINSVKYTNPTLSYKISELRYTTDQMLRVMDQDATGNSVVNRIMYEYNTENKPNFAAVSDEIAAYGNLGKEKISPVSGLYRTTGGKKVYPMNKGDKFTIVIKNTNVTIASMLFNTLTFGAKSGSDTKVYINYGGTIKNEEYRDTVIDTTHLDAATNLKVEDEYKELDVNKDTIINKTDKIYLDNYLAGLLTLSDEQKKKLDVNGDGNVTSADSVYWLNNYQRLLEKKCRLENTTHDPQTVELKDATQVVKDIYNFNDETIEYSSGTGSDLRIKYNANIYVGDIVYTKNKLGTDMEKGYYQINGKVSGNSSEFEVQYLGENNEVTACTRCGKESL